MGKNKKKPKEKSKRQKEYDALKGAIKSTEQWAKHYQETEGLTYEQAMIKAWNRNRINKRNKYTM